MTTNNSDLVAFRMSTAEYDRLKQYAQDNGLNVSEAIRRAIKWMMLLYNDKDRRKNVRRDN